MSRQRWGKIVWTQLYIDAMESKISGLSPEATGAYTRLLLAYLKRQGPLPNDNRKLAKLAQIAPRRWPAIRDEFEAHGVFVVHDGLLRDDMLDERIERFREASERNSRNADRRWKAEGRLEDAQ